MWETLNPWAQATRGTFGGPWCQATAGVFCPAEAEAQPPRWIVSPAPGKAEKPDRRRHERDMKDLSDLLDILGHLVT